MKIRERACPAYNILPQEDARAYRKRTFDLEDDLKPCAQQHHDTGFLEVTVSVDKSNS